MKKIEKDYLLECFLDIAPNKKFNISNKEAIENLPQFLIPYLEEMKKEMIRKYPHREEYIKKGYDHIIADMSSEKYWLCYSDD